MKTAIQVFNHEDFGNVRVVEINGEAWFVAADVCKILGLQNPRKAVSDLDNDEKQSIVLSKNGVTNSVTSSDGINDATFGWIENRVNVVNEPGLYRLIFASRKPEAKKFQHWVFHEILPSIRKTGGYSLKQKVYAPATDAFKDTRTFADEIQAEFNGVKRGIAIAKGIDVAEKLHNVSMQTVKELIPPAEHETGFLNATQIGERLNGLSAKSVNKMLAHAGLQYKNERGWRLTDEGSAFGEELPFTRNGHSGYQVLWNEDVVDYFKN